MGNSYIYCSSFQPDMCISPAWRPCWGLSQQILSCLITPLETQPKTYPGGSKFSTTPKSLGASLVHASLWTKVCSQMLVQESESALLSMEGGMHGGLSPDGKKMGKTLDGRKLLALSFLSALLSKSAHPESISRSLETIEGLSRAGEKEEVEIRKQIMSSDESTTS